MNKKSKGDGENTTGKSNKQKKKIKPAAPLQYSIQKISKGHSNMRNE